MMEACDATKQHAQIYHDAHKETGMIVDANLRVAEEIAARTQTLSQNLTDLSPLRQRLDELEAALSGYERIADKILRKG
ncbi:Hypothetical Protein FCC1311_035322 [Hondaea fermentalgiana]|uniref:Uncharacterized protein n=1 Tax=Hondaea fermentalgiana TaxID=2315210 RepID=A0A2R5G8I3_9STRA|nr:Hypothetical Protein FCC1311_035322 [Hondaea fermentalgiana]|eukprot:GBG27310.1 Hypothetical Protein FCC1311_035322 [Hondaea fermentalgiana]